MWYRKGKQITNERRKVWDIQGGQDVENRNIIAYKRHGKINQQFDIIYADQWKGEPGKGQLNKRFGLYVERTFYIVSRMSTGRYLDIIDNRKMVIKTQNGRKTQKWYFDQRSLSIKTRLNNQSWDIQSSGRTNNMQIWSTNSRWW
jgi:membrane carboxypeptidase/penicillin-binding protein PbpC